MNKVYFIQQGLDGPIKIGTAVSVSKRLIQLQSANPSKLFLIARLPGDATAEKFLHKMLADYRMRGEWFFPCKAVLDVVSQANSGMLWDNIGYAPYIPDFNLIDTLGGVERISKFLSMSPSSVIAWRTKGIPHALYEGIKRLAETEGVPLPLAYKKFAGRADE